MLGYQGDMKRNRLEREATLRQRGYSDKEIASARRFDARSTFLIVLAILAVVVMAGLFGYSLTSKSVIEDYPSDEAGQPEAAVQSGPRKTISDFFRSQFSSAEEAPAQPEAEPAADTRPASRPRRKKAEVAPVPAEIHVPQADPVREVSRPQYAGPEKDAVRRTTIRALKRGQPQVWKEGGQRGYVLVSAATEYNDRHCRQVSYTLIATDNAQIASAPVQWCQIKRGEWGEDPYTGK